ncbi:hypothetical protein [Ligilactobacillus salivarius]|uniref:hypothetical protein n=1 Tax=Ligilactobacillus salivarius TaxID=1624 RepID=UPI000665925D|nr:hypothetical protein [Ligilactobacillus salivarius]
MNNNEREVTIFLANGETLHFTNVSKLDAQAKILEIDYIGRTTGNERKGFFNLGSQNIVGYAVDY